VLAAGAVAPGPAQGDRPEHSVDNLLPVAREHCLVAAPAVHARAAVAGIGRQRLPEHAAAELQQAGPQDRPGRLQAGLAARRPGGLGRQAAYLGGFLRRERRPEPPFSPPVPEGSPPAAAPAAGRASQIASFTSMICSAVAVNSACRAISRRTFSASPAASCRPTLLRRPCDLVHRNRGP
jgi:hypothetical protein